MNTGTCIVTGGNAGIGKEIAMALARLGRHVVIISRDPEKGRKALEEIRHAAPGDTVEMVTGNLDSIGGVRALSGELLRKFTRISTLINNAGVWPMEKKINADGLEYAFMVNHMAPLILSSLLLERLRANAPARIINVNAGLYVFGKIDMGKTPYGHDFSRVKTYMNTKLCNILFTRKFARMIEGSGVTVNAVHPGVIKTNLGDSPGFFGWIMRNVIKRTFDTQQEGAQPPVWLATSSIVDGVNGKYYELKEEKPYTENALDDALMEELHEFSVKKAGL